MKVIKPKIGLLGITQELYDDVVEGITEYQIDSGNKLVAEYSDFMEIVYPGPAKNRLQIEKTISQFNQNHLDGIIVVMLTYAPSVMAIRAFKENNLPILLFNIQPESTVAPEWDMANLTYNQGIHGMQDMANCLHKLDILPPILSGDWKSEKLRSGLFDWVRSAQAVTRIRRTKIAIFGQMPGMGDITSDPNDIMRVIGSQIDHTVIGEIYQLMQEVKPAEIKQAIVDDHKNFDIDPSLPPERHKYAASMYLAIKKYLVENSYDGFCIHFDTLGLDGRFDQIHMLAASKLMAEGYGYSAEGDVLCSTLMVAGHIIETNAHFTEMYAMDFTRNAVLMSHMGEGNWKITRKDRKPMLIDRELKIGGLGSPPTVLFTAEPGPATLVSLVNLSGGKFRLVVLEGEILDDGNLPNIEMPYFFIRPKEGKVEDMATSWLQLAGTHHQVLHLGYIKNRWKMFCQLLGIEYAEV